MGQPLSRLAIIAIPSAKWRLRRGLDYAQQRTFTLRFCPQRHKTEWQNSALRRPVENFPIAQLASSAERHRAGSNSSQREGCFSGDRASVGAQWLADLASLPGFGTHRLG